MSWAKCGRGRCSCPNQVEYFGTSEGIEAMAKEKCRRSESGRAGDGNRGKKSESGLLRSRSEVLIY